MPDALKEIRVLEYADFVAGPFCSRLFADLGAEIIKVERPEIGDSARYRGPFSGDIPHPERSGLFLYLNTNKLGISLNIETNPGKEIFKKLVEKADILIESNPPGTMKKLGLDYDDLKLVHPKLVMTSITPFGQGGPYSSHKAYYLNIFHAGGEAYCLPGGLGWLLYSDREPIKVGGFVGEYNAGVGAAIATLGAMYGRNRIGGGQHIDVSQQEVLLGLSRNEMNKYNDGWIENRATRSFPVAGLMQCKDGFVQVMPLEKRMWDGLLQLMGNPEWAKEKRYQWEALMKGRISGESDRAPAEDRQQVNDYLEEWMLQHTKQEICSGLQERKCAAGMVCTTEDLLKSEQLKARGFFSEIDHPEAGKLTYPGLPYKFSRTPWQLRGAAPLLGQHNEEIYCRRLGYSKEQLVKMRQAGVI